MRRKELDAAWGVHDASENPNCAELPGFNEKMGHSEYNPGCQAWARKYATEHPVPRLDAPAPKGPVPVRLNCDVCDRSMNERHLWQEPVLGALVCSKKCELGAARKAQAAVKAQEMNARSEALKKALKEKGLL